MIEEILSHLREWEEIKGRTFEYVNSFKSYINVYYYN